MRYPLNVSIILCILELNGDELDEQGTEVDKQYCLWHAIDNAYCPGKNLDKAF